MHVTPVTTVNYRSNRLFHIFCREMEENNLIQTKFLQKMSHNSYFREDKNSWVRKLYN